MRLGRRLVMVALAALLPLAGAKSYLMRVELKAALVSLGAVSDRGQFATAIEAARASEFVSRLEAFGSDASEASQLEGSWELILTDVEPFRASPFFMTLAAALDDFRPGAAERVLPAHRLATAVGEIGRVRQRIALDGLDGGSGTLTSEVDIRAGFLPGLPASVRGTVVTSATVTVDPSISGAAGSGGYGSDGGELTDFELDAMDAPMEDEGVVLAAELVSTRVRGSTFAFGFAGAGGATSSTDVPLGFLDNNPVPVGQLLNRVGARQQDADADAPRRPRLRTTYLDEDLRVSRTEDEHYFVFVRATDE